MKRDEGRRLTDAELEALEKRIREMYGGAAKNLQQIIDEYFANFRLRDEEMKKLIGTIVNGREWTEEDYKQWRLAQMGRGERFEALRDKLAERLTNANEVAISYVNDATPGIYTLNRNYAAYSIERRNRNANFTLFNEDTVRRLIVEQPDLMPYYPKAKAVRRGIDLAYGKKQITNAVTSGILMGRSVNNIAADLRQRIINMSIESAIRAARTAVTAAENGGREATYERAEDFGIYGPYEWDAKKDFHTRNAHRDADGQLRMRGEPFDVGGEKLMFPGDKSLGASGWNIYNCRCSKVYAGDRDLEEEPRIIRVRNVLTGKTELIEDRPYNEWYEWKRNQNPEAFDYAYITEKNRASDLKLFEKYREEFGKNAFKTLADMQNLKYNDPDRWSMFKKWATEVRTGKLSTFADFDYYMGVKAKCDGLLVGETTSNGIHITQTSVHFVSRIIGSENDRRDGVDFGAVEDALFHGTPQPIQTRADGGRSQRFIGKNVIVTVNPDTGVLVQCNSTKRGRDK